MKGIEMIRAFIALMALAMVLIGFAIWIMGGFLIVTGLKDGTWAVGVENFGVGWIMCVIGGWVAKVTK